MFTLLLVPLAALAATDRLSVVTVQAVDDGGVPQLAVKWSGELPVSLEVGFDTGKGGFIAASPPVVLTESMTLLPHPDVDVDKPLVWQVRNAQSRILTQMKGSSPAFEWKTEPFAPGFDAEVLAVTVYQGELIAGGMFTEIGGETVNYIARWDGSAWSALSGSLGTGVNDMVVALTVHDGDLYAGGWFTTAGGVMVNRIARWDGSEWSALSGSLGTGVNNVVVDLAVHGGDLIVGGHFVTAGGVTVNRIARWDGSEWSALSGPSGVGVNNPVFALTAYDGDLYAGGWFTTAGGVTVNHIARWDGSEWSALAGSPDPGVNHQVNALTVYDGDLVASGAFSTAGGVTVNRIARWDGSEWSALSGPSGTGVNGSALALTVHNGDLIAGGWFTTAGGLTVNRIARWDGTGWSALLGPSGIGVNDGFRALTVLDGDVIAGGNFTSAGGVPSTRIGRYGIAFFTVGGTVSGLVGSGLVLQNNGGDDLALDANGPYGFAVELEDLSSYTVTVVNQPINPSQTCSVANASGALSGTDLSDVDVTCVTDQFTVSGTLAGLVGDQLVLQNNGGDAQVITADGGFTFSPQDDGSDFEITVLTQPNAPSQTCSVANGLGTMDAANVSNVEVTCITNQYMIGGSIAGLQGDQVVLQNNAVDLVINADGAFSFPSQLDGTSYAVTVTVQPVGPSQTCTVNNGSGTLSGAEISNIQVTCVTDQFTIGGTVIGLKGTGLVVQNNDGDDLALEVDGVFTFASRVPSGELYNVSLHAQPTNPRQNCAVFEGSGTVVSTDVNDVIVKCDTLTFTVTATATGNGTITPPTRTVVDGTSADFTVTPDAHHQLASLIGDTCTPVDQGGGTWTAESISEDCAVTASFARDATDLQVAKGNGLSTVYDAQVVVYAITVANAGPMAVSGATLVDILPANLVDAEWACLPEASGSVCPPPPFDAGSGDLYAEIDLPVEGYLRYDLSARVLSDGETLLSNTATVATPAEMDDLNPLNNSATDTTVIDPEGIFATGFEAGSPPLTVEAAAKAHLDAVGS